MSNFNPRLKNILHFQKHYMGPYSQEVSELVNDPQYFTEHWVKDNGQIKKTKNADEVFKALQKFFSGESRFAEFFDAIKLIRKMYDKLSRDEFLLLIYLTYPAFIEKSKVFSEVNRRRASLAQSLFDKGIITQKRFEEITARV